MNFFFQAQFGSSYSLGSRYSPIWNPYSYYGDRSCPLSLLSQLSNIVETLYGYGQDYSGINLYGNMFGGSAQGFSGLSSAALAYQTSPMSGSYNPTCPWPLINGLLSQIQQYVSQMQSASTGTVPGVNPFPFGRNPPFLNRGGAFGPFRGGVKK